MTGHPQPHVPAEPMRVLALRRYTRDDLAKLWATRYNCSLDAGRQAVNRLVKADTIPITNADRWETALEAYVYPELH